MTDFNIAEAEKRLARFDNAQEEGMSHETGYDFSSGLADDLAEAITHIRKLETLAALAPRDCICHTRECGDYMGGPTHRDRCQQYLAALAALGKS